MSTRILVAGDHFILPSIFADAIRAEVNSAIEFREYQSPWPGVPFGAIAEVTEASGSEDELIQALEGASVYVANHAPLTRRMLESCPDLRLAVIARGETAEKAARIAAREVRRFLNGERLEHCLNPRAKLGW